MPTATVSAGNPFRRDVPAAEPDPELPDFIPAAGATANTGLAQLNHGLGTREQIQADLDGIAESVRGFFMLQPHASAVARRY